MIDQVNIILKDFSDAITSDINILKTDLDNFKTDKNTNWNYGDYLPRLDNFHKWPTCLAIIDNADRFRPSEINDKEAIGLKITNSRSISEAWIILCLENDKIYYRVRDYKNNFNDWKIISAQPLFV